MRDTDGFRTIYAFPETTALKRYAVKTSEKSICKIALGLLQPDPLGLCTLGAQEVTMKGVYRLPHAAASQCQTLCKLLVGDHE